MSYDAAFSGTEMANIEYREKISDEASEARAKSLMDGGIHPVMAKLYALRGVEDVKEANLLQKLEPFSNLKGIDDAVRLLAKATLQKKKICIVADYDVDGATACAIAVRGLRMFGASVGFVVPDRFVHGYGLTPSVVDEAIRKTNPDLLITVDNGIASNEGVDYARKKGLSVLVTDHHLPGDVLPNADCIVNPNQGGCGFKSKSLAGCGVMFYVLAAFKAYMEKIGAYGEMPAPNVFSLLDLVAIGTIADVVKLDSNNRMLVKLGLGLIRSGRTRPGVSALIDVAKRNGERLTTTDIGFALGPRINAAGRLEDMTIGINCLLTDDENTAKKLAKELDGINKERKKIETDMREQAMELPELGTSENSKVVFDPSFHEGVVGIVASRIKEEFYRPTIVFAEVHGNPDLIKGSGRSIQEVHLRDALDLVFKRTPGLILKFGGHAMAAGLTIEKKNFEIFSKEFDHAVSEIVGGRNLSNVREIDMDLPSEFIQLDTAAAIQDEIWGQGFPYPIFKGRFKIADQKVLKDAHLKLKLEKDGQEFDGIWFFTNAMVQENEVEMAYSLGINEFLGKANLQIMVEGILA